MKAKDGRQIVVYRNRRIDEIRGFFKSDAASVLASRQDMAGYVLVAWDNDGSRSCAIMSHNGRVVPRGLMPEFVRRAIEERLGAPDLDPVLPDGA